MQELETSEDTSDESQLRRIYLRNHFGQLNSVGAKLGVFKYDDSVKNARRILTNNPHNSVTLEILKWLSLYSDDLVDRLDLKLSVHELDPDCPEWLNLLADSVYRLTSVITDNWLAGEGSGSELTKEEIRNLFLRIQHTLLDGYDVAIEQKEGMLKLQKALESVYDPVLSRSFRNFQQVAEYVEIGLEDFTKSRRADLIRELSKEYDTDSDHSRSESLEMMCSDHAFELGLLDHCLTLLSYFGINDSDSLESPALDWTRAAIVLLNALSRDCSEYPLDTLGAPDWWSERRCFAELQQEHTSNISELLGRFERSSTSAEHEVLQAYLRLDATSDKRYISALKMDASVVKYAAPLSKRLHRLGNLAAASNILANTDAEYRKRLTKDEHALLERIFNSIEKGIYRNWNESAVDFKGLLTCC